MEEKVLTQEEWKIISHLLLDAIRLNCDIDLANKIKSDHLRLINEHYSKIE